MIDNGQQYTDYQGTWTWNQTAGIWETSSKIFLSGSAAKAFIASGEEFELGVAFPPAANANSKSIKLSSNGTSATFFLGNSTSNATINSTAFAIDGTPIVAGATPPGGGNTAIQFNNSGLFGGVVGFTFNILSNTVSLSNTFIIGANVTLTNSNITVGNSTVNTAINSTTHFIGNSTVFVTANSTVINVGGNTINSTIWTGQAWTANNSTNFAGQPQSYYANAGSPTITTQITVGNSTVNVFVNSTIIQVSNATNQANLKSNQLVIGGSILNETAYSSGANVNLDTTRLAIGNSTANLITNSIVVTVANASARANLEPTQLLVGPNVILNTATLFVGNSTTNTVVNSSAIAAGNATANAILNGGILITVANSTGRANVKPTIIELGSSTVNSTAHIAGANAFLDTDKLSIGNTTANLIANSIIVSLANSTSTSNLQPTQLLIGANVSLNTSILLVGNSVVNATVNSTAFALNGVPITQQPIGASLTFYKYTATAGQTSFSGADDNAAVLTYFVDKIEVFLNGVKLIKTTDYTASNTTHVVLTTGATIGDTLEVTAFGLPSYFGSSLGMYKYTASTGQTSFSGTDDNSKIMYYTANMVHVHLNGSKLPATDYTASNGSHVVLASGASNNDILEVTAFGTFTWASVPGGTNTNILFNDSANYGGSNGFTFNKTTNNVSIANTLLLGTSGVSSFAQYHLKNGKITETHTGNAVTFAVKTLAGNDANSTCPVSLIYSDGTQRDITAAVSLTVTANATLGAVNSKAFNVVISLLDNAGTQILGVQQCSNTEGIFGLPSNGLVTTVAEGGTGTANSAGVMYASSAVTKQFIPVAMAQYDSGLAAVGKYDVSPSRIILVCPKTKLPGDIVKRTIKALTKTSTTSTTYVAVTGSLSFTLSHAANWVWGIYDGATYNNAGGAFSIMTQLMRDGAAMSFPCVSFSYTSASDLVESFAKFGYDRPNDTSAHTYQVYLKVSSGNGSFPWDTAQGTTGEIQLTELVG